MDPKIDQQAAAAIASPDSFDELDPHGEHHHAHVIVRLSTLVTVLVVLLMLTVLTVGQYWIEGWVSQAFNIDVPQWINVAIVMTIALIKGTLVCLYFMQLKYDNPINAIIFIICVFTAMLFVISSMTDLGNRNLIDPYKAGEIVQGGTQYGIDAEGESGPPRGNKPIYLWARENAIQQWGPEEFAKREAQAHGGHHGPELPSAQRTFRRTGLSGALDGPIGGHEDHGHAGDAGHGGH